MQQSLRDVKEVQYIEKQFFKKKNLSINDSGVLEIAVAMYCKKKNIPHKLSIIVGEIIINEQSFNVTYPCLFIDNSPVYHKYDKYYGLDKTCIDSGTVELPENLMGIISEDESSRFY